MEVVQTNVFASLRGKNPLEAPVGCINPSEVQAQR